MPIHGTHTDVRTFFRVIRRRKWTVLLVTLLTVGAALGASYATTPIYASSAEVQVNPLDADQVLSGYGYNFLYSMQNEVTLATSSAVSAGAATIVSEGGGDPADDTGSLSVENPVDTSLLIFTYSDPDPADARLWAQAHAESYIAARTQRAAQAYEAATAGLQGSLADLRAELTEMQEELLGAPSQEQASLQAEINSTISQIASQEAQLSAVPQPYPSATELVSPATLPTSPSSPQPTRNAILALILGLGLGIGAALLRERFDDRTADKSDLEAEIGAPVIGIIPQVAGWRKRGATQLVSRDAPASAAAEAYRSVRTNLQFLAQTQDLRVIAVTSANLGEGKTTTTANLAVSLSQTGARVLVISADLRKPRLHQFFGVENITGLSDVLQGFVGIVTAAQRSGLDNLRIVASGPVPTNPAELLGSPQLARLVEGLRGLADFVLIDTPPVLAVADALPVARAVDGVLVVADAEETTRTALTHVREQLEQVGATIVGGIYNNLDPSKGNRSGYYGYGYAGYAERDRSPSKERPPAIPVEEQTAEKMWE